MDRSKVQIRIAKSGKQIASEEDFSAAIEKEADTMGILRLFAVPRGMLMLPGSAGSAPRFVC